MLYCMSVCLLPTYEQANRISRNLVWLLCQTSLIYAFIYPIIQLFIPSLTRVLTSFVYVFFPLFRYLVFNLLIYLFRPIYFRNHHTYKILLRKPDRKGGISRGWENNIRMGLREIGWEVENWIHLAQYSDQWQFVMKTLMNFHCP
jgi:hypothetical protein